MISGAHHHAVRQRTSKTAVTAAVMALVVDALYLAIIWNQGEPSRTGRVAFVATAIAAVGACAAIGATRPEAGKRIPFLGAATGGLFTLGYLGLFSIGVPLLIAGGFAAAAWVLASRAAVGDSHRERVTAVILGVAAPVVVVAGIALT